MNFLYYSTSFDAVQKNLRNLFSLILDFLDISGRNVCLKEKRCFSAIFRKKNFKKNPKSIEINCFLIIFLIFLLKFLERKNNKTRYICFFKKKFLMKFPFLYNNCFFFLILANFPKVFKTKT